MELLELSASIRKTTGKEIARNLRKKGLVPAILYGPNTDPITLSVDSLDIDKILKHSGSNQAPLSLSIINGETVKKTAMIKDLQVHPLSRRFLHVDFYEVALDRKIQVKVPVVLSGKAKGTEAGGTIQLIQREIEVLCFPLDIPESITIDVSGLDIGDSIHVEDLPVDEHIEIIADTNFTVVTVSSAMAERRPGEIEGAGEEGESSGEEGTEEG